MSSSQTYESKYANDISNFEEWKTLLLGINELLEEHGLADSVVFHGTSTKWLDDILTDGLCPTDLQDAYFKKRVDFDDPDFGSEGTFWGLLRTAAWYAEDTVVERNNCDTQPILIAADTLQLSLDYALYPDKASLEGPIDKALPVSTVDGLADAWLKSGARFRWERGLKELGAIFAVHDEYIDPSKLGIIRNVEDFRSFLIARNLIDAPAPGLR